MNDKIKETHKKNKEFNKKYSVKKGDIIIFHSLITKTPIETKVEAINSFYGWICDKHQMIAHQRIKTINGVEVKY